ncbi:peptidase S8 [Micromonospora sp. KC721]|nr:peptidase S8 [Micromonospora sp. KC721]
MTTFHTVRRRTAVLLVTAMSVAVSTTIGAQTRAAAAAPAAHRPYTVTLVTGDRVSVASRTATTASVEPAAGREDMSFAMSVVGGHLLVIPSDAQRLVQTQRADRRLFDISELIKLGYDDRGRSTVPLIMEAAALPALKKTVSEHGARTTRELTAVKAVAVSAPKDKTASLWEAARNDRAVHRIWLDGKRQPLLDGSVPQIGAPAAWQAGYTGKGISVAVLDTGVDASHPDLAGRVVERNFTAETGDRVGHGTHVASIIAGTGVASGGRYRGVAPEATVVSGKVCEMSGCSESAILAGMHWAAVDQGARVINVSLGGEDFPSVDPLEEAVTALTAQTGALFVIAAGNAGAADTGTIASPGSADAALTVGAVDSSDAVAGFSSRGPRTGDEAIKPDISAPGVGIVAARAAGTEMGEPAADFPASYVAADGTSMATPHVAGAAALLAQEHPGWRGDQLKATLMGAAERTADNAVFDQGAGRVDVRRAITQTVTADPPSVSFGLQPWPHDDDTALTKTITYRNTSSVAVALALNLTHTKAFTLSTSRVEVPPGGTADVTVTADTRHLGVGPWTGHVVATAGETRVVTPLAVRKEDERYAVTLRHIGLDGKPARDYLTQIFQPNGRDSWFPYDPSGTVTLRLPKGRYTTATYLHTSATQSHSGSALLYQPILDVSGDTSVTFDARQGKPVRQSVPDRTAEAHGVFFGVSMQVDGASVRYGTLQQGFDNARIAEIGTHVQATGYVMSTWARRDSGDIGQDSPYAYYVGEQVPGDVLLAGYHRAFRIGELAAVTQTIHSYAPGQIARQWMQFSRDDGEVLGVGRLGMRAPGNRINYYSTQAGSSWLPQTAIGMPAGGDRIAGLRLTGSPFAPPAGSSSVQEWGAAPYTTAFNDSQQWVTRSGDTLQAVIPSVSDAGAHSGYDTTQSVTTRLYRGDELLDEQDWVYVAASGLPAGPASYRITQDTTGSIGGLGTRTQSIFAFQDPAEIFTIRYEPRLDSRYAVVAGTRQRMPVKALDTAGRPIEVRQLALEFSFDDGTTWQSAVVAKGAVTLRYPRGSGHVSLRVSATGATGAETTQTVIRAYRYQ